MICIFVQIHHCKLQLKAKHWLWSGVAEMRAFFEHPMGLYLTGESWLFPAMELRFRV